MSDEATYGSPSGGEQEGGTSPASEKEVSAPEGSQPEVQEPQGNEQAITPQYLKEMETRIKEELRREAQSMTDKMGSRLDKEIQSALVMADEAIKLGKEGGVKYTPEQERAIKDRAINNARERAYQQDQQPQPLDSAPQPAQQPQDQGNQQQNPWAMVSQEVQRIMSETGVYIPAEEANKLIIGEDGENKLSPFQYVQAFESLARQRQLNNSQPNGPSPTIPTLATGGRPSGSQGALRQSYEKEMAQIAANKHPTIRRGDISGIQRLEIAYRKKGLEL